MQVLKFGGTSMGSAQAIEQVCEIVKNKKQNGRLTIVASAMSGITDKLIQVGTLAGQGQEQYKTVLEEIENKHLETIRTHFSYHCTKQHYLSGKKALKRTGNTVRRYLPGR